MKPGLPVSLLRRHCLRAALVLPAWMAFAPQALAARGHTALTRVTANREKGTWQFEHQVRVGDIRTVMSPETSSNVIDTTTMASRARLVLEIERRFQVFTPSGVPLPLCSEHSASESDEIIVYQSTPAPTGLGRYVVSSHLLQLAINAQAHTVSVELTRPPQLLRLTASTPLGSFVLR